MSTIQRVFTVDGRPFFPLGGQSRNSSGYSPAEAERAFRVVAEHLGGNTVGSRVLGAGGPEGVSTGERPRPPGLALEYDVRLILLWFATWKNGDMDYAPPG